MADEKKMDVCHVSVCVVENGYKISCTYEPKEQSLGQRAGWVPPSYGESKDYVEKTKDAVLKRLKEIL
jgi:hypothetical protein